MISAVLAAAILFAQAEPAAAPAAPPASTAAAAAKTGNAVSPVTVVGAKPEKPGVARPDELVCRTEPVLGTLFPKRICARRDELAERQRIDQAETRKAQALRPWKDPGG